MSTRLRSLALLFALSLGGVASANGRERAAPKPSAQKGAFGAQQRKPKAPRTPQKIFLSLGGEGEVSIPGAKVLDINLLDDHPDGGYVIRKGFRKTSKNPLVKADMTKMPFREGFADGIVGNRVPMQRDFAHKVAKESFRVLKPGAQIKIFSTTGGAEGWRNFLTEAGFVDLHKEVGHMVGTKPHP